MQDYTKKLQEQREIFKRMINHILKKRKEYDNLPEGSLRVTTSQGCPQYYFREKGSQKADYMPTAKKPEISKLAQREYEYSLLRGLKSNLQAIDIFLRNYDPACLDKVYNKLCKGRKALVKPLELTDELFVEKWLRETEGAQNMFPDPGKYETEQGEIVRSKSEKILADLFYKKKIPYRYEPKLPLADHHVIYPDFICLNIRERKSIYWEHLGLVNNPDYAARNMIKIEDYEKNGIYLGDRLLVSMETPESPLDINLISRKIDMFLK